MPETNGQYRSENGRFDKGNPGKPQGAVTKVSVKVKEAIVHFVENNVEKIQESFDQLEPAQKLRFISEILQYTVPKLQAVESNIKGDVHQSITVTFDKSLIPTSNIESPPQGS